MRKKSSLRTFLNRTSFQAQLFMIVLLSFVFFVVAEYFVVQYTFRTRYSNNEMQSVISLSNELASKINESDMDYASMRQFYYDNSYFPLVVTNKSGEFLLQDSKYSRYSIDVTDGEDTYNVNVSDASIKISEGDNVSLRIRKSANGTSYDCLSINVDGIEHNISYFDDTDIHLMDHHVEAVYVPENVNYLFDGTAIARKALSFINNKSLSLERMENSECSSAYAFKDMGEGNIYYLFRPNSYGSENTYILVFTQVIDADSILSMVSTYYGYIILITIVIAILISLFIARAFSHPIKQIESDMKSFAKGNFSQSSHDFRNMEMISLEDTLNNVKNDTREKVENIENQARSLEQLNSEILKQEELRKVFIQRLSHELKTPLMVASATTEALMSGLISPEEKDREYENILNELDKATEIIKDIINTYKSTNKEMRLNKSRFDLTSLVKSTVLPLLPLTTKQSLKVKEEIEESPIYVDADEELISQVISNFITNAFKYTNEGNLVEIILKDKKTSIVFMVRNHGARIKDENIEKIWLPFYREQENVDSTSTGMGLFIVKTILQSHGFKYDVRNFDGGVESFFEIQK